MRLALALVAFAVVIGCTHGDQLAPVEPQPYMLEQTLDSQGTPPAPSSGGGCSPRAALGGCGGDGCSEPGLGGGGCDNAGCAQNSSSSSHMGCGGGGGGGGGGGFGGHRGGRGGCAIASSVDGGPWLVLAAIALALRRRRRL